MTTLSLDGSGSMLYAAVSTGGKIFSKTLQSENRHSEMIIPLISELLLSAGSDIRDVCDILLTIGPGSFTGLRIVLSTAKGISSALGIPLYGMSTLEAYSLSVKQTENKLVVPIIDARKSRYYAAIFFNGVRLLPDSDITLDKLFSEIRKTDKKKILFVLPNGTSFPDGLDFDDLAVEKSFLLKNPAETIIINRDKCFKLLKSQGPVYIRLSDAEQNLLDKSIINN